jgi:hypothetical protein
MSKKEQKPSKWSTFYNDYFFEIKKENNHLSAFSVCISDEFAIPAFGMSQEQIAKRVVSCLNAMEGIEDPEAFMKNLKELNYA